jgi:hypothetical protein
MRAAIGLLLFAALAMSSDANAQTAVIAPNGVHCTAFITHTSTQNNCIESFPGRPGVRCSGAFGASAPNPPTRPAPTNYSISELGKPGVPLLDVSDMQLLRRIEKSTRAKSLRYAYLVPPASGLVIYDATRGPCADFMYEVLDTPGVPSIYYRPGEDPSTVVPVPDDFDTPFPWMTPRPR